MMEERWIQVRDRHEQWRAEAEAERLARLVREAEDGERADPPTNASAIVHRSARSIAGRRLVAVSTIVAEPSLKTCDCPEA